VKITYVADGQRRTVDVDVIEEPTYTYGIEVADLDAARVRALGLPRGAQGVVVTRVAEGSVADQRDEANRLLPGDVIVSVGWSAGNYRVTSSEDFENVMRYFADHPPQAVQFLVATKEGYFRVTLELKGDRS
jgi:S1-C subfamily serine protease